MSTKRAPTFHTVLKRKNGSYTFAALMRYWPLHGEVPTMIVPTKVVINLVEVEREGHGRARVMWEDKCASDQ